jgi:putative polyketide hydroxylase
LLDSYQADRHPVASFTLQQALLRMANPQLHWGDGPQAAAARAASGIVNAPIVHMGYRYDSDAVIDPQPELPSTEDIDLVMDGAPGSRLPHVWLERDGRRLSTLDLVRSGFVLLTGAGGDRWVRAAQQVADRLGVELAAYKLDADADADVAGQQGRWPHCAGLGGDGALLVRPDQFVAWRAATMSDDPAADLTRVLTRVLLRGHG